MMARFGLALSLFVCFAGVQGFAMYTELGASYNYKRSTFDANNTFEQEASTVSLSFYFWEQLGLEFSYTNSMVIKRELANYVGALLTTTTQWSNVYGDDLIYVLASKQDRFQPYVKAGIAYVEKKQVIQAEGQPASPINVNPAFAPSYGVGFKYFVTESMAIRAGYDVIHTPIDNNTKVDDINGRVGLSWIF